MTLSLISNPSPNFDSRGGAPVSMLVLHYTGMRYGTDALSRLCDPQAKVSSHYMVEEDGRIFALVDETERAWHAGVSFWRGLTGLNTHSIGIEIVNPGHEIGYHPFPQKQMNAVLALSQGIVSRYSIAPYNVVAHSDIAPTRKIDPGELFDWEWLAQNGVGLAPPQVAARPDLAPLWISDSGPEVLRLQNQLGILGYKIEHNGAYDEYTQSVVRAFQRHFRRQSVTGVADSHMRTVLEALLDVLPRP